ncbi:MAG TPA: LysR family transcriptional regulator [Burkholderiaceae bacterium]
MSIFDDLSQLRAFSTIVEAGSISAAARALHTTQPTLSRQLSAFEARCGAQLLRRDTHRMHLTDTGHRVLADARAILTLADESAQRLKREQGAIEGRIRLFSTIDFGQTVVSRLIASFIQAHPAVSIELAYSNRPLHMIEEGCDAGIIAGALTDDSVVARPLGRIVRHLFAAPSFLKDRKAPKKPQDIEAWPWMVLPDRRFGGSPEIALLGPGEEMQTLHVKPVMVSEGVTSLREAARMGLGVTILPDWLAEEDVVSGRLVRVLPKWQGVDIPAHLIYPAPRHLPLRVRVFIDFAAEYMAAQLKPRS